LDERGTGDLERAARGIHAKLIARHPHVFGAERARSAAGVKDRWEEIKRTEEGRRGVFHEVPENLPGLSYARKVQQRARSAGFEYPDLAGAVTDFEDELRELRAELPATDPAAETQPDPRIAAELGDVLFAAVNVARRLNIDPELEVRTAAKRFRTRVERAVELAAADARDWTKLPLDEQDAYYDKAKENE
jgi:XTP/dITP diphosphohydrolase/tetrapyrrole methylase family protein/MazG family protein/ATP diphosphatase